MPVLTLLGDSEPVEVSMILYPATWVTSGGETTYTISNDYITAISHQMILPATTITKAAYEAFAAAEVVDAGQSAGSLTLKALGDVPSIEIPIRILFRAL